MKNIILIGMPSCGKSTVGLLLAKQLGYRFIDSDLLIQEREGKLLHELIAERGVDGFLSLENEVNASIDAHGAVIATGGSAVYGHEAMEHLKKNGTVIYLKIPYEALAERLGDYVHRGVVMPEGYTLRDMFDERAVLYERYADCTVDESLSQGLGDTVARVAELLRKEGY
ncbi:MAG: shikimate kinase [Clostridia bacterium]|nr:shikimate kinase [Clostridia bacterium]